MNLEQQRFPPLPLQSQPADEPSDLVRNLGEPFFIICGGGFLLILRHAAAMQAS